MAYTSLRFVADSGRTTLQVPFPYLDRSHVRLQVNGTNRAFAWDSDTQVNVASQPIVAGDEVFLYRSTSPHQRLVNYSWTNVNTQTLNTDSLQAFYRLQEIYDHLLSMASGEFGGGGGGGGGGGVDQTWVQSYVQSAIAAALANIEVGDVDGLEATVIDLQAAIDQIISDIDNLVIGEIDLEEGLIPGLVDGYLGSTLADLQAEIDAIKDVEGSHVGDVIDHISQEITQGALYQNLIQPIETNVISLYDSLNPAMTNIANLQGQVQFLSTALGDITNAPAFDPNASYIAGNLVVFEDGLYRALTDMNAPSPSPSEAPANWQYMGDYSSLLDLISDNQIAINALGFSVETLEDEVQTRASFAYVDVAVSNEESARVSAISQLNAELTNMQNSINSRATISYVDNAVANESSARATAISQLEAQIEGGTGSYATVTYVDDAVAAESASRASSIQTVEAWQTDADGRIANRATVQRVANVEAATQGLQAEYTIKLNAAGQIAAIGLAVGGGTSQVQVVADQFSVAPAGGSGVVPFSVIGGTVYINSAMIREADIDILKLGGQPMSNVLFAAGGWGASTTVSVPSGATARVMAVVDAELSGAGSGWHDAGLPTVSVMSGSQYCIPVITNWSDVGQQGGSHYTRQAAGSATWVNSMGPGNHTISASVGSGGDPNWSSALCQLRVIYVLR